MQGALRRPPERPIEDPSNDRDPTGQRKVTTHTTTDRFARSAADVYQSLPVVMLRSQLLIALNLLPSMSLSRTGSPGSPLPSHAR